MGQFSKEFLRGVISGDSEAKVIEDTLIDHRRWVVRHRMVFKYQDKFYEVCYDVGATELQDEGPFEWEQDPITVKEVRPINVTTRAWITVEESNGVSAL